MEPTDIPRRVTRACDYCRKKRLKCTGQRPCLNCQLYRATCTTSEPPNGAVAGRKRKRPPAGAEAGAEADPERSAPLNQHEENEDRPCPAPAATTGGEQPQPALAEQPWVPTSEPQIEIAPDFDQYARDLGLVLAPFWPPQSQLYPPLDELDATEEAVSGISYNHLPTPRLSEPFSLDLPPTTLGNLNPGPVGHPISPRSAHELFLKKGPLDSKFIGMGSVGSTIFECLRHSSSTQGNSMETTILNHLIRGIQHVDEMALSTPFHTPPLPEKDFAEEGVKTYYDFVHLLYPIMDDQFFQRWQHIYDDPSTLSPAAYSRFCLVVAIGNLASLRSDNATWEMAKLLQERTWSLMDHITANAFMESTQVLLLHTVFLLYSAKTGIAWTTCGMAIRTAQSLGLHQQTPSQLGLSAEHIKLRSRLWSVAYTLDAFLSLSEGRPPAATLPPNLGPSPSIYRGQSSPMAIDPPGLHVHDWDTGLATIANEVHLVLKDSDSAHSALSHIADIDSRLLAWKERIPMDFRPEQQILAEEPLYSILAILHLEYHNLMRSIHWISITLSSGMPPAKLSQMGARVRSSEAICLASARSVIDVLNSSTTEQKVARRQGGFVVPYYRQGT